MCGNIVNIHPESIYLATFDDIQGLVTQGRIISETVEIAGDVAKKLSEEQKKLKTKINVTPVKNKFDLVVD